MRIILDLDEDQEMLLVTAVMDAGTAAWEQVMHYELCVECGQEDHKKDLDYWQKRFAAAEGLLKQFPASAIHQFREELHSGLEVHITDDDEEEES